MLDMSVRAKILELMIDLKRELDLTYLYITHDLATAKFFCDRIAIMYLGRIVEIGPADRDLRRPRSTRTRVALLRAIPEPDPTRMVPRDLPRGEVPDAVDAAARLLLPPPLPAWPSTGAAGRRRDLRTMLESALDPDARPEYRAEREVIGSLDVLDVPATSARIEPAGRATPRREVAETARADAEDAPEDPFWKGVLDRAVDDRGVTLTFHDGVDPVLAPSDRAEVACLLYPGTDAPRA